MDTPAINNIVGLLGHREPTNDETKDAVREAKDLIVGVACDIGRIADALEKIAIDLSAKAHEDCI